jgi:hypothetical protein
MPDVVVTHPFVSTWPTGRQVKALTDWNAGHVFSGGSAGEVLAADSASASGASWTASPVIGTQLAIGQAGNTVALLSLNEAVSDAAIQFGLNVLPTWSVSGVEGTGVRVAMSLAAGITKADGAGLVVEVPILGAGASYSGTYYSGVFRGTHGHAGTITFAVTLAVEASADGTLWVGSDANPTTAAGGILFGSSRDTNLYRSAANALTTDDSLRVSGSLGVTGATQASAAINIEGTAPVSSNISRTVYANPTFGSSTTSSGAVFLSAPLTQAAAFTLTTLAHFDVVAVTIGAASAVTTQIGLRIAPMANAANNYGVRIGKCSNITLWVADDADYVTAAAGITFGVSADTDLYRGAANQLKTDDALMVVGAFGCNNATPQTPVASGGALAAYVTGAFGLNSDANMLALYNQHVAMRAALVAMGIMS